MHSVVVVAALAPTLASVACTVVPARHGGAGVLRERAAAVLMGVSALDMVVPAVGLAHATGWGAALVLAALTLLAPLRSRDRHASRRVALARHAASLLVMAATWWAMAAPAVAAGSADGSAPGHAGHAGTLPLVWLVVAVAAALAVVEVAMALRSRDRHRGSASAWRHPLMAVGMAAMALAMPEWLG